MAWGYVLCAAVLLVAEGIFVAVSRRKGLVFGAGKPDVAKGGACTAGGWVFMAAMWLGAALAPQHNIMFVCGATLLGLTSLIDDFRPIDFKLRLLVQAVCMALMMWQLSPTGWQWWLVGIVAVAGVGTINGYNFMDGINGITPMYGLAVLGPLIWLNARLGFMEMEILILAAIAACIFALFNARSRTLCFAGDTGSTVLAFILFFAMARLIEATGQWGYAGFMAVYWVDSGLTLLRRVARGEDVTTRHLTHAYQLLVWRRGVAQLLVAGAYAAAQLVLSICILASGASALTTAIVGTALFCGVYWMIVAYVNRYSKHEKSAADGRDGILRP